MMTQAIRHTENTSIKDNAQPPQPAIAVLPLPEPRRLDVVKTWSDIRRNYVFCAIVIVAVNYVILAFTRHHDVSSDSDGDTKRVSPHPGAEIAVLVLSILSINFAALSAMHFVNMRFRRPSDEEAAESHLTNPTLFQSLNWHSELVGQIPGIAAPMALLWFSFLMFLPVICIFVFIRCNWSPSS